MKLIPQVLAQGSDTIEGNLPFKIPTLTDILAFTLKFFFVIAGLAALVYLILGAFSWITSGGDKEAVSKAQQKIQAAVVGLIVLVLVLSIIVLIEQVIFNQQICFGITCPINFGSLLQPK